MPEDRYASSDAHLGSCLVTCWNMITKFDICFHNTTNAELMGINEMLKKRVIDNQQEQPKTIWLRYSTKLVWQDLNAGAPNPCLQ